MIFDISLLVINENYKKHTSVYIYIYYEYQN